jgi:hypothetical protein
MEVDPNDDSATAIVCSMYNMFEDTSDISVLVVSILL